MSERKNIIGTVAKVFTGLVSQNRFGNVMFLEDQEGRGYVWRTQSSYAGSMVRGDRIRITARLAPSGLDNMTALKNVRWIEKPF